jgi:DNA-binding LacI/PurR family transcriptional regulator
MGLSVPADVTIVGFDDLPMAEFTTPSLTTVCMPIAEMAAAGVKTAIDEHYDRDSVTVQILKPQVVIRDSSGPAPRGG